VSRDTSYLVLASALSIYTEEAAVGLVQTDHFPSIEDA
jgi:hypothetical protein